MIQRTVDWDKEWFVDFNAEKTPLVSFDQSNDTGSIAAKMNGTVLEEISFLAVQGKKLMT